MYDVFANGEKGMTEGGGIDEFSKASFDISADSAKPRTSAVSFLFFLIIIIVIITLLIVYSVRDTRVWNVNNNHVLGQHGFFVR